MAMVLQLRVGNRAVSELIALQRTKDDAAQFAEKNGLVLGYGVHRRTVKRFVEDKAHSKSMRAGLLQAWNLRNPAPFAIRVPGDLARLLRGLNRAAPKPVEVEPASRKRSRSVADMSFDPKNKKRMRFDDLVQVRGDTSDNEGDELGVDEYREAEEVAIFLSTGYGASKKRGSRNFVSGPGKGQSSAYPNIIPRVTEAVGGHTKLAALLETGLMNMPEFEKAISGVSAQVKDQVQFVLVLMFNEIIGRSTSNLIDIMTTLKQAQKDPESSDDKQLVRRMLEWCLFAPKGGQPLSRIGHRELPETEVKAHLRGVLAGNQAMYYSLAENLGAKSPDELVEKFKGLYDQFRENFKTHVMYWYDDGAGSTQQGARS
jgi:hypothetical protein